MFEGCGITKTCSSEEFTDEAIDIVAKLALEKDIGARGLRSVLEKILLQLLSHHPLIENQQFL